MEEVENFLPNFSSMYGEVLESYFNHWHQGALSLLEKDKRKNFSKNSTYVACNDVSKNLKKYSRLDCVRFMRLVSGYVADPLFLFKIGVLLKKECVCSHVSCNLEHILWHYPQYIVARYGMQEKLTQLGYEFQPKLQMLLVNRDHSALKTLFEFLEDVNIKI